MIRKSSSEKAIAERVKLLPIKRKTKKIATVIKILTPYKPLTRLPALLAQLKV